MKFTLLSVAAAAILLLAEAKPSLIDSENDISEATPGRLVFRNSIDAVKRNPEMISTITEVGNRQVPDILESLTTRGDEDFDDIPGFEAFFEKYFESDLGDGPSPSGKSNAASASKSASASKTASAHNADSAQNAASAQKPASAQNTGSTSKTAVAQNTASAHNAASASKTVAAQNTASASKAASAQNAASASNNAPNINSVPIVGAISKILKFRKRDD